MPKHRFLQIETKAKSKQWTWIFLDILREDQKDTDSETNSFTKEDGIQNLLIKLDEQLQWFGHLKRMDRIRILRQAQE